MSAVLEKVLKVETEHITVIAIAYVMPETMCTNYKREESRTAYGK